MKLDTIFLNKKCPFALEVFPPKRHSAVETVYGMLDKLGQLPLDYISVTYSAGGTGAKEYTAQIANYLKTKLGVEPLAHLTCYSARRNEVQAEFERLRQAGVENVLALRGDKVPDVPPSKDYAYASDLVGELIQSGSFYVVAACYPEGHPESPSLEQDVERLRNKPEAGAGHLVSQLFFDNAKFFRYIGLARSKEINCPIEAGVMPITKPEQISRTVSLSSASLPADFTRWVSLYADSPEDFYKAGIDYSIRQIRELIEGGADGIHLYAMNNPDVACRVYEGIQDLLEA